MLAFAIDFDINESRFVNIWDLNVSLSTLLPFEEACFLLVWLIFNAASTSSTIGKPADGADMTIPFICEIDSHCISSSSTQRVRPCIIKGPELDDAYVQPFSKHSLQRSMSTSPSIVYLMSLMGNALHASHWYVT